MPQIDVSSLPAASLGGWGDAKREEIQQAAKVSFAERGLLCSRTGPRQVPHLAPSLA